MTRRAPWLFLALALAACSSDELDDDANSAAGANGAGGSPDAKCPEGPGYGEPTEAQRVDQVTAKLVDQDGTPLDNEMVQVCGIDVCIYGASGVKGVVDIEPHTAIKKPAFKPGEGKVSARFAWLLPRDESVVDLGTVRSIRLPEPGSGEAITPGGTAHSNGLELTVPEGGVARFDTITFQTAEERDFRAAPVPLDGSFPFVDPELGFGIVFAATPTETKFCPPAKLTVENSAGWEPGQRVDVYLHGVDVTEEWAPYGGWAKVSEAVVSEDGERVETTAPGIPVLGVLGFKLP